MIVDLDEEKKAIRENVSINDKVIITGGAGTGKTFLGIVLGQNLLKSIKISQKILYLTYSKLAKIRILDELEKKSKSNELSRDEINRIQVENYHSIWWNILRDNYNFLGIKSYPIIYTKNELELKLAHFIQNGTNISQLTKYFQGDKRGESISTSLKREIGEFVQIENIEGRFWHNHTYFWVQKLLKTDINIKNLLQFRYPVIIIDEFQDTDEEQWGFIKLLNPKTLIVFGDNKQNIYSYQMNSNRLTDFTKEYSGHKSFQLQNLHRFKEIPKIKSIMIEKKEMLNQTKIFSFWKVLNEVKRLQSENNNYRIAILCRYNSQVMYFYSKIRGMGLNIIRTGTINNSVEFLKDLLIKLLQSSDIELRSYLINNRDGFLHDIIPGETWVKKQKFDNKTVIKIIEKKDLCDEIIRLKQNDLSECLIYLLKYINFLTDKYKIRNDQQLTQGIYNISKYIAKIGKVLWNDMTFERKRILFDSWLVEFEFQSLKYIKSNNLSIMTIHQAKSRQFDYVIFPWFSTLPFETHSFKFSLNEGDPKGIFLFLNANTRAIQEFVVIKIKDHFEELPPQYPNIKESDYIEKEKSRQTTLTSFF